MSTTRDHDQTVFECDDCGTTEQIDADDFRAGWAGLQMEGWRAFKDKNDEWCHRCPDCGNG